MSRQLISATLKQFDRLRTATTSNPRARRALELSAIVLFIVTIYLSRNAIPAKADVDWRFILISSLVVSPLMVVWMGAQYHLAGQLTGQAIPTAEAARVALLSGAANLLPIPGSVAIRAERLQSKGVSLKRAAAAATLVGLAWLGSSGLLFAVVMVTSSPSMAAAGAAIGGAGLAAYGVGAHRLAPEKSSGLFLLGVAQGLGMATTAGVNLLVVGYALDFDPSLESAFVISVSGVLAAAVGIFPGGLGLREGFAVALSGLIEMSASEAALAAATVHLTIIVVLLVGVTILTVSSRWT